MYLSATHTAKVMPPQRPDLVLATNVPDVKLDVLVGDRLNVEADRGDGCDILAELELVQNGGLAGGVETQHEKAHFLGSKDPAHHLGELATHCGGFVARRVEGMDITVSGGDRGRSTRRAGDCRGSNLCRKMRIVGGKTREERQGSCKQRGAKLVWTRKQGPIGNT